MLVFMTTRKELVEFAITESARERGRESVSCLLNYWLDLLTERATLRFVAGIFVDLTHSYIAPTCRCRQLLAISRCGRCVTVRPVNDHLCVINALPCDTLSIIVVSVIGCCCCCCCRRRRQVFVYKMSVDEATDWWTERASEWVIK